MPELEDIKIVLPVVEMHPDWKRHIGMPEDQVACLTDVVRTGYFVERYAEEAKYAREREARQSDADVIEDLLHRTANLNVMVQDLAIIIQDLALAMKGQSLRAYTGDEP